MTGAWRIAHTLGHTAAFHDTVPPAERSATFHDVVRPTLVLGSAQRDDAVDRRVAEALGVEVIRRRSGGGAVLLLPGEFVWLDLVIPAADPLWERDVAAAMRWVGELWRRALADVGVAGTVHGGALVATPWSRAVCFAGMGTGEVMSGPAKLVGVSQRRTRDLARFQSMCHLRWRPEIVAALVGGDRPSPAELAGVTATVASDADAVRAALSSRLP